MRSLRCLALLCALLALAPAAAGGAPRRSRVHHAPARRHHHRRPKGRPARSSGCANAALTASSSNLAVVRTAVLCLVNAQRTSRGLPALSDDSRLDRSAQGWTQSMTAKRQFTHGADFAARISAVGFDWSFAGENIATGYPTPAAVIAGWMASTGHCRNILEPGFSAIGIGMVAKPVAGYASGPATWTQDFALPMGTATPSHDTAPQNGCPY